MEYRNLAIIEELLTNTLTKFKQEDTIAGLGYVQIKELLRLATLFGFKDLAEQTKVFILNAELGDENDGALQNFKELIPELGKAGGQNKSPDEKRKELLEIPGIKSLKENYPIKNAEVLIKRLEDYDREWATAINLIKEEKFEEVVKEFQEADFDHQKLEMLISTLFMLGNINKGAELKEEFVEKEWSYRFLDMVELIERSQLQDWEHLAEGFQYFYPEANRDIWSNFLFAKGLAGIVPFEGYPFNEEWDFQS